MTQRINKKNQKSSKDRLSTFLIQTIALSVIIQTNTYHIKDYYPISYDNYTKCCADLKDTEENLTSNLSLETIVL